MNPNIAANARARQGCNPMPLPTEASMADGRQGRSLGPRCGPSDGADAWIRKTYATQPPARTPKAASPPNSQPRRTPSRLARAGAGDRLCHEDHMEIDILAILGQGSGPGSPKDRPATRAKRFDTPEGARHKQWVRLVATAARALDRANPREAAASARASADRSSNGP